LSPWAHVYEEGHAASCMRPAHTVKLLLGVCPDGPPRVGAGDDWMEGASSSGGDDADDEDYGAKRRASGGRAGGRSAGARAAAAKRQAPVRRRRGAQRSLVRVRSPRARAQPARMAHQCVLSCVCAVLPARQRRQ